MALVEPMLVVRRVLREQINILHRRLLAIVRDDEVCRRLMTVPGVGPVVALTYRATVPQIQVSWSGVRTHVLQGSVGRKRPPGRHIALWG